MATPRAVDWMLLDHTASEPVRIGDMVSVDAGGMPIFRVVALEAGQVWLGDERHPAPKPMALEAFRWRGAPAT